MAWYHKVPAPKLPAQDKRTRVEGLWIKCDECGEIIYKQEVERNLELCPKCGEHFELPVRRRLDLVLDPGSFVEHDLGLESTDPLQFSDSKRYRERIRAAARGAGETEAFVSGIGRLAGREVSIGAFHFGFMGGSMGSVVGEKVTRIFERATDRRIPAIVFSASGGVQGDVILAEPRARIGFAGPRVIEQTLRQKLPEGFQRSEFLLKHGMIDAIVPRRELRDRLSQVL